MQINEGGNVFKDADGNPRTQRINLADIASTVKWLEGITGLPLQDNMLGSTGLKPTSGDLDLAVDSNKINKEEFYKKLSDMIQQRGQDPRDWVRKTGTAVHLLTPIGGRPNTGFVQTDFMFLSKPEFSKWILRSDPNSEFKGASRNVLINSMAKSMGYKLNQVDGIADRSTNELITDDPDEIARMLLNPQSTRDDLGSVERILAALKNDPKREEKLADFRDHMQRAGTPLDENVEVYQEYNEVSIMARLRDRIVNQGMQIIVEGVRIEHPEDMVLDAGSRGLTQALQGILAAAQRPETATVKWDGKLAIIFGRKPTGEFVLTDKSGFLAKGYDGLATSPEMVERIMAQRGGERGELITIYRKLFPMLRRAVPQDFRGYIQGDLLFVDTPQVVNGAYEFMPNTVKYRVPVDSELGKKIGSSQVGVVIHTALEAPGAAPTAIRAAELAPSPGLLILDPSLKEPRQIKLKDSTVKDVQRIISQYGTTIDQLFNPAELRARKITDFPQLIKQYLNSRVRSRDYSNLVAGFGEWVQQRAPAKTPRIFEWATANKQAVAAVFQAFLDISSLKNDLVRQLDAQAHDVQASVNDEPGHEGYVGQGMKFVDRMRFSAANFARNNPELT
jgi:nucleotide-binding universal stress UspA family protein